MWTVNGEPLTDVELAEDLDRPPERHVMVTGGTGFIGGQLAERLVEEEGAIVHILARDIEKADRIGREGYRVTVGDMNDPDALREAVGGCDLVYHCAHAFGLGMADALRVNVGGTRNVMEAAHDEGVSRFVYLSSVAVYGRTPMDGTDETVELDPTGDPYADSKIEAEKEILRFSREHGLPAVILRPAIVYGPRSTVWSLGILRSISARHPFVIGDGSGICNSLYIDNLVDAMLLAGEVKDAVGEAFIITDGEPVTWGEFVGHYARMLGLKSPPACPRGLALVVSSLFHPFYLAAVGLQKTPSWEPARFAVHATRRALNIFREAGLRICAHRPGDIRFFTHKAAFDTGKARELLGWQPEVSLVEGMAITEAWFSEQGYV